MVCALPAFAALRRAHPSASVDVLASPLNAGVVEAESCVSEALVYDAGGGDRGIVDFYRTAKRIQQRRYDAVIVMRTATFANALARCSGARLRVGYAGKPGSSLLTHRLQGGHARHLEHEVDRSSRLVDALDASGEASSEATHPAVSVTDAERAWASERMQSLRLGDDAPLVAIHPGASSEDKCYPGERYALAAEEVADALGDGARVAVLEGPADGSRADAVASASASQVLRPGRGTLRQMMALMKRADVMLVNDSGPMHLAAALGTPLAAVFGPTDHRRWMPRQPTAVLVKPDAARPGALPPVHGASNVCQIPSEWVVDAAMAALATAGQTP